VQAEQEFGELVKQASGPNKNLTVDISSYRLQIVLRNKNIKNVNKPHYFMHG